MVTVIYQAEIGVNLIQKTMNDHNEIMQSVLYKGKTIKFKLKQFPATPQHLMMIAENYFSTGKEVRDMEI